jgi:hypothetical protein
MKVRTIYFRVIDMKPSADFWKAFLRTEPNKTFPDWQEFLVGGVRIAILRDKKLEHSGSGCVPVFEVPDDELTDAISRAKGLGAKVVLDGLEDPEVRSIVFADPAGHEFEITTFHD